MKVEVFALVMAKDGELYLKVLEVKFGKTKISGSDLLGYPDVKCDDPKLRQAVQGHNLDKGNTHVILSFDEQTTVDIAVQPTSNQEVVDLPELLAVLANKVNNQ